VSKWELADALPPFTPSTCVPPNQRERSLFDLAASAIEQGDQEIANWLEIGAQKYLAKHQFRTEGGRRVAICTPDEIFRKVETAFEARKGLGKGRLVEYQLELAARLPSRNQYIVEAIGKSAFNPHAQESDIFKQRDIRPFARTILATFGGEAKAFQTLAYE